MKISTTPKIVKPVMALPIIDVTPVPLVPIGYSSPPSTEGKEEKKEEDYSIIPLSTPKLVSLRPLKTVTGSSGDRQLLIPLSFAANLSTNGSGFISASVLPSSIPATTGFTSLAAVFDEFFIESMEIHYQPMTRYQVLPNTTSTEFNGTALGLASLYLDATAYTNINQMPGNPSFKFCHTSSPFKYTWKNNVSRKSAVSEEPDSSHASLAWVRTNATPAQYYGGAVTVLGSASSAMHASTVVGIVAVRYNVWFRSKST